MNNFFLWNFDSALHLCLQERSVILRVWNAREERIKAHGFCLRDTPDLAVTGLQQISTSNDFIEALVSKSCKQASGFFSNEFEEVHHVFRSSWKLLSKLLLLTGY